MFEVEYSTLVHYPSLVSKDCITLAILFFNKTTRSAYLLNTKNWDRVRSFNDDLDIDLVKLQLQGIDEEIHDIVKAPDFTLNKYIKFFQNDLKFTDIITISTDNYTEFINECSRQYFMFDYKKSDRPNKKEQLSFIKRYLRSETIEYTNKAIHGYFNENITFDFIIDEYAFKFFRLEDRNENRLIRYVKDWAYDALKLKNRYKIIFVVDIDFSDHEKYKTVYTILNEDCYKLISFREVITFIQSLKTA